jgi:hypothetical protein
MYDMFIVKNEYGDIKDPARADWLYGNNKLPGAAY